LRYYFAMQVLGLAGSCAVEPNPEAVVKLFLAHSFDDADCGLVAWFRRFLEKHLADATIVSAKEPKPLSVIKKIQGIDDCDVVFGILSRRGQYKVTEGEQWGSVAYVISELGYAYGRRKRVCAVAEECVDLSEIGLVKDVVEALRFNRDSLDSPDFKKALASYLEDLSAPKPTAIASYIYANFVKHTYVHVDGSGTITMKCCVEATNSDFRRTSHTFSPGDSGKKGLRLPPVRKMQDNFLKGKKPYLAFRVLAGLTDAQASQVKIEESEESRPKLRKFNVVFPQNTLSVGDQVTYEWTVCSDDLFPMSKKDLAPGKREQDLDYIESALQSRTGDVESCELVIHLPHGCELDRQPSLEVYDASKDKVPVDCRPRVERSALFDSYIFRLSLRVPNGTYQIRWQPR